MTKKFTNIDIHSHLNFKDFDEDRAETIARAHQAGVAIINIGTGIETSREVVALANDYDAGVYAMVGIHPIYVEEEATSATGIDWEEFENLLKENKVVGIGECGLDYFHIDNDLSEGEVTEQKNRQAEVLRRQIELAIKYDLPIMIHCRDAYPEVLEILEEYKTARLRGNVHFFAGTKEDARRFLDLDFTISFTGVITFAPQYRELVEFVSLDKMHAETDCPYVAPAGNRGKRNEPAFVLEVVEKIAEIKGLSVKEVSTQLKKNAEKLFGI